MHAILASYPTEKDASISASTNTSTIKQRPAKTSLPAKAGNTSTQPPTPAKPAAQTDTSSTELAPAMPALNSINPPAPIQTPPHPQPTPYSASTGSSGDFYQSYQ